MCVVGHSLENSSRFRFRAEELLLIQPDRATLLKREEEEEEDETFFLNSRSAL